MSVIDNSSLTSASSAGVPGLPTSAANDTKPIDETKSELESGVPTVRWSDAGTGGLHEGSVAPPPSAGGPWMRFALPASHCL